MRLLISIPATLALVYRAWSHKSLTPAGIAAAVVTALVHSLHPWSAPFALLGVFFLAGTAVTKVKHDIKSKLTLSATGNPSSSGGGESARNYIQVLANSLPASILIVLHVLQCIERNSFGIDCWRYGRDPLMVGIVANYAAVSADTFSSELGILSRSKPRLITSTRLRPVPPGTNGGVTLYGLLAGFLGAFIIAVTSAITIPFCQPQNSPVTKWEVWSIKDRLVWVAVVTLWGGLGSVLDSVLGGWLQASVVDLRTGKIVEGMGGGKVLVVSEKKKTQQGNPTTTTTITTTGSSQPASGMKLRSSKQVPAPASAVEPKLTTSTPMSSSRKIESGLGILDNNAVNLLMALIMSFGAVWVSSVVWDRPVF
ncbi:MAG: hypothetical protein M1834_005298 [Cirrosporium novae-zelandiae]|nr:MAG: hypothetical protein M1834_005298 [Cirrosporium novae-zelandiae]